MWAPLAILSASLLAVGAHPARATVSVGAPTAAPAVSPGFIGFSVEYGSIAEETGPSSDPDPLLDALVDAVNPGRQPVIRIGGDSTDHTWYPVSGDGRPGFTVALTPAWISSVATFAQATRAKLILGIDLEMNDPSLARVEADRLEAGIGRSHILAWEVGNEPNLYTAFPWYVTTPDDPATGVYVRPRDYDFAQYRHQYTATARALPKLPLAGPAIGDPTWMSDVPALLKADPAINEITYHAYPTNCYAAAGTAAYPTVSNLLSTAASVGLADGVADFATEARSTGRAFRVDELNSSACGGAAGVSDTFASALWVTDTLFALASQGVSGVNIQDFKSSVYKPFGVSRIRGIWTARVFPLYYGLLLFSRAAPAGSTLLSVRTAGAQNVTAWAARTPARPGTPGRETVTLINHSTTRAETVAIRVPGAGTTATLSRMLAPRADSQTGVTLAGQSYGAMTTTGQLTGSLTATTLAPASGDTYEMTLSPASAALLTLAR